MLRGPTTLIGPGSPIVIIDGVRVDSRQYDMPLGFGAMAPSRLDDLFSEDIARIEVLGGAAAALYGDGASNGVILVTTKSGGGGPLHLSGRVAWSATQNQSDFPANYRRVGTSPSTDNPSRTGLLSRWRPVTAIRRPSTSGLRSRVALDGGYRSKQRIGRNYRSLS